MMPISETLNQLFAISAGFIWKYPVIILCVLAGLFYTLRLGFVQIRGFSHAISLISGKYDDPNEEGHISHFQALSAALSGTIGIGNMAGVAIAISMGGPGAVFWMWVIAFIGMATKYAECSLATYYREKDPLTGEYRGGPMYYITKGMGEHWKPMASFFALCTVIGAFGAGGMFQSNQAASALFQQFGISKLVSGFLLASLLAFVIIGGIKRIGQVASKIVPSMCVAYILVAFFICLINYDLIPMVFQIIVTDAFTGNAAVGGVIGSVIIIGVRRAVFSNEAGLGSAAIAHAAVKTDYPIREGIVASLGPFIDTICVCSATAMVIILGGVVDPNFASSIEGLNGINLTSYAFDQFIPGFGTFFISIGAFLFAFSTLITWSYYGETASKYLFGNKGILPYKFIFVLFTLIGAVIQLEMVLNFSDLMIGLMVIPNSIAILWLSPVVVRESKAYFEQLKTGNFKVNKKSIPHLIEMQIISIRARIFKKD